MATKRSIQTFMSAQKRLANNVGTNVEKIEKNNVEKIETKIKNNNNINPTNKIIYPVVKEIVEKIVENVVNNINININNAIKNIEPDPTQITHDFSIVIPEDYFPENLNETEKYSISFVDSSTKIFYITETMEPLDYDINNDLSNNNVISKERVSDTKVSGKFNYIIGLPIKSNEKSIFYTYFNSFIFNRTYKNSHDTKLLTDLELITPEKITFEIKSKLSDANKIVLNLTLNFKKLYDDSTNIESKNNESNIMNTKEPLIKPLTESHIIQETKIKSETVKLENKELKSKKIENKDSDNKPEKNKLEKKESTNKNNSNIHNIQPNNPSNYSIEKLLNIMNKKLSKFVR